MKTNPLPSSPTLLVRTIALRGVNCFLIGQDDSFILVDTGFSGSRRKFEERLRDFGCIPGKLALIVLTHGDSDHSGNAAYLRSRYATRIAMHAEEAPAVQSGDPAASRSFDGGIRSRLAKAAMRLFPLRKRDRFSPDLIVGEGFDLGPFGFPAKIVQLPGHSKGSIGVAAATGELFCGDLLMNRRKPGPGFGIFDDAAFRSSLEKIRRSRIATIYPGHGAPFAASMVEYIYR
jgi:hydroxyacylglutathione hydrolase